VAEVWHAVVEMEGEQKPIKVFTDVIVPVFVAVNCPEETTADPDSDLVRPAMQVSVGICAPHRKRPTPKEGFGTKTQVEVAQMLVPEVVRLIAICPSV